MPELCRTPLFYNIIHSNYGNLNKKYMHFYYIDKIISQKNIFFTSKFLDGGHRIQKKLKFHEKHIDILHGKSFKSIKFSQKIYIIFYSSRLQHFLCLNFFYYKILIKHTSTPSYSYYFQFIFICYFYMTSYF